MNNRTCSGLVALVFSASPLVFCSNLNAGTWYGDLTYTGAEGQIKESVRADTQQQESGWQLSAGYDVNQHFAVEFGYIDLGQQSLQLSKDVNFSGTDLSQQNNDMVAETKGLRFASIGKLPISSDVAIDFQAGALLPRYKTTQQSSLNTQNVSNPSLTASGESQTFVSTDPELFVGLGIHWRMNPGMGVKVFWEKMNDLGNDQTIKQDINTYNLALRYQF